MDDPSPGQYREFLTSAWSDTLFFEYSLGTAVVAVSVIDHLTDALSCVYTFFDPAHARRSLGTFAILHAIDTAHRHALEWLYLGYYIADSPKMRYKADYRPQERYVDGRMDHDRMRTDPAGVRIGHGGSGYTAGADRRAHTARTPVRGFGAAGRPQLRQLCSIREFRHTTRAGSGPDRRKAWRRKTTSRWKAP